MADHLPTACLLIEYRRERLAPMAARITTDEMAEIAPDRLPLVVAARTIQLLREAGVNIPPARPEVVDMTRVEAPEQVLDRIVRELGVLLTKEVLGMQACVNTHQAIVNLGVARAMLISKIEKKEKTDG